MACLGRDEMIDKLKSSIVAAGKAGLPVVEYDFFPHRANEGYKEIFRAVAVRDFCLSTMTA